MRRWPEAPIPHTLGRLRGSLAEARGEPEVARRRYLEDLLDPTTARYPFVHAEVLYAAGRLERARGNRKEAVDHLADASAIFMRLRAAPMLERCRVELAACGLSTTVEGPLTLTPREEDVASLIVRGYSNKEAAAELFLTARTVEYHLRNIYAKLGVTSRYQLRKLRDHF